ncbi:DUF2087 domain-containing protein [Deinococcus maricopensis]|uniref:DUF2087 domain-containing protein n=1 Tax=Deinococcus maricopensis (strain DSM 21211 / LMG 22137 / NRRL B-23946 / LB-34) TaxID=709986 RepID=E8U7Y2_DEIML|nr:DUF2087 domain-containing protein [Deinococcus maricopensis]ADV67171.1 Protein of unknown function DUF2087 [Deinococcus maricopensis DSM 21211]
MTKSITTFLDEYGRVTTWPSKRRRAHQLAVLDHLVNLFENGRSYTEQDVNALLQEHSTLEDYVLLRRELVEGDYLTRTPDGRAYWRASGRPGAPRDAQGG